MGRPRNKPAPRREPDPELLPCPWCGRVPKMRRYALAKTGEVRYGVWCNNGIEEQCPMIAVETMPFKTKREAAEAWNKRA